MIRNYRRKFGVSCNIVIAIAALGLPTVAQTIAVPPVPTDIQVPPGNTPYLKGSAEGTQNYICLPTTSGLAWKFQGPQATLFLTFKWMQGEIRQQVTTHFLSPNPGEAGAPARATWQSSLDTSAVWAKKIAESTDPDYVAPGAIPWFLLQTTGTQFGPNGGSMLAGTTYIQRLKTTGGIMPTTACTEAGAIQFVPYTADYYFYRASRAQ
ncbi:MAG: DUF3455 domain-containing protein [Bryobacteraceae bacterium]